MTAVLSLADAQPEPEPTSWCRLFAVGPVCAHLCAGCQRINNPKETDDA